MYFITEMIECIYNNAKMRMKNKVLEKILIE